MKIITEPKENVMNKMRNMANNALKFYQNYARYKNRNYATVHWFTTTFHLGVIICAWFTLEDGFCTDLLEFPCFSFLNFIKLKHLQKLTAAGEFDRKIIKIF